MRARTVRPDFWLRPELARLPHGARLAFIGIQMIADREGRLPDSSAAIASLLFPLGGASAAEIERWLAALERENLIQRYKAAGGRYIEIRGFSLLQPVHAREPRSRIPPPPAAADSAGRAPVEDPFQPSDAARRIWLRHPAARRSSLYLVERAIAQVLDGAPGAAEILRAIDDSHAAWCASPEWEKERGRYAPRLDRWILERRYEAPAPENEEDF